MAMSQSPRRILFAGTAVLLVVFLLSQVFGPRPSNHRDWMPDQARLPRIELEGRRVRVHNLRHARYRSTSDYDVAWEERTYDLDQLRSAWFVVEPFVGWKGPAHTLMSFGFDGLEEGTDNYLAISVEIR